MSDELPSPAETDAAASPAEPEGPKETITEVVGTFKDVDVKFRDVWQDNLEEQFEVIRGILEEYPYVGMVRCPSIWSHDNAPVSSCRASRRIRSSRAWWRAPSGSSRGTRTTTTRRCAATATC